MTRKEMASELFEMARNDMENIHAKDVAIWKAIAKLKDDELIRIWKAYKEDA